LTTNTYPRDRLPVLLLENIHPRAAERFREEGYPVELLPMALDETALAERLTAGVAVLGRPLQDAVTQQVLAAAPRLLALAAFCIGTDRIDERAAALKGARPCSTRLLQYALGGELAIAEIIALNRRLFDRSRDLHAGTWTKSAEGAAEVRGKKLGVVGYGAIGSQLSVVAEAIGLEVHYFDTAEKLALGNARKRRTLHELLGAVDMVSLHVDGRAENKGLIGRAEFAAMRDGAVLLNLSRGHVVDLPALADAVRSGKLAGAAIDVFPEEPDSNGERFDSVLRGLPNVILTPHIGGSTAEAQEAIAEFAADRLLGFLHRGDTRFAVNMPNVELPEVRGAHRLLHVHENRPGLLAAVNAILASAGPTSWRSTCAPTTRSAMWSPTLTAITRRT
jgi:D-3-phosphoglycerate dehydrogenase